MEQIDLFLLRGAWDTNQNLICEIDSFGVLPQETHCFISSVRVCQSRFKNQIDVIEKFPNGISEKEIFNDMLDFNKKLRGYISILNDSFIFPPEFRRPLVFWHSIIKIDNIKTIRAPTRNFFCEELYR